MSRFGFAATTSLILAAACAASPSPQASGWSVAVDDLAAAHQDLFSFRFLSEDGASRRYTVSVHAGSGGACNRYGASANAAGDFWYMEMTVNGSGGGTFPVVRPDAAEDVGATAYVTLLHRRGGEFVEAYDALAGELVLRIAPSVEEYRSGAVLRGSLAVDFPVNAVRQVSCEGSVASGGASFENRCHCADATGTTFICDQPPNGPSCCHDLVSPRRTVRIELAATPCDGMCRWLAGLDGSSCGTGGK